MKTIKLYIRNNNHTYLGGSTDYAGSRLGPVGTRWTSGGDAYCFNSIEEAQQVCRKLVKSGHKGLVVCDGQGEAI